MARVKVSARRARLLRELAEEARHHSTATVLLHAAVAKRLGLNHTDHKFAELLLRHGPMAAGALAARTGLTTGAVTGVINRLEGAGWVRRERDPGDARRVIVRWVLSAAAERRAMAVFGEIGRLHRELLKPYSDAELQLMLDYTRRARELGERLAERMRAGGA